MTTITPKKDLFNGGQCFTKGKEYTVSQDVKTEAGLMEITVTNDQGQPHKIGSWWRDFEIVHEVECNKCYWKGAKNELVDNGDDDDVDDVEVCPDCGSENLYFFK